MAQLFFKMSKPELMAYHASNIKKNPAKARAGVEKNFAKEFSISVDAVHCGGVVSFQGRDSIAVYVDNELTAFVVIKNGDVYSRRGGKI